MDNLKSTLEEIYMYVSNLKGGKNADYIPQLSEVNPNFFGVSVCTIDGCIYNIGDHKKEFTLQSVSKVLSYLKACSDKGPDYVHKHVGHEPSGRSFNEFCFNEKGLPFNPMINSGAIMVTSMITSEHTDMAKRFSDIETFMRKMSGDAGVLNFDNKIYLSERDHADTNRALSYMMKGNGCFPEGTRLEETLDLYFQMCSIATNTETVAIMGATLANCGICPINQEFIISPLLVQNVLTLMSTCGMYDYSGEWAFQVGIPAKSGVSGCILMVIPGVAGICVWSPPLDSKGNSYKGIEFAKQLIKKFPHFHTHYSTKSTS